MLPAVFTTFLWSFCVVAARRSVDQLGENAANFWRLLLAVSVLGLIAHIFGGGFQGAGLWFFVLSGVIGFGLGDIGVFYALPRIGSRLSILMAQCVAAPIAGIIEWLWMGTVISLQQIGAIAVILCGIGIALLPEKSFWLRADADRKRFGAGILFGLLAAFGQGFGAVLSRRGYEMSREAGEWIIQAADPGTVPGSVLLGATTGFQRLVGGIALVALFWGISRYYRPWRTYPSAERAGDSVPSKLNFIALNATSGPIVGIICFQWALSTTPSGIVQPIIAMTPLAVIPLARWLENDRITTRSVVGAVVAVCGAVLLAFAS